MGATVRDLIADLTRMVEAKESGVTLDSSVVLSTSRNVGRKINDETLYFLTKLGEAQHRDGTFDAMLIIDSLKNLKAGAQPDDVDEVLP